MYFSPDLLAYVAPGLPIWVAYSARMAASRARYLELHQESIDAGLTEPPSLHPVIDPLKCIGCSACIKACPEHDVLGLIDGRATLIAPSSCIGHGACQAACPTAAIELVFGTATRGMDIPHVDSKFQTNVPGIYIAGELGGMGLIRNAVEQGRQAVAGIAARRGSAATSDRLDLLIVGAGPAGISASLAAKDAGLRCRTVEQDSLGGTVAHYPRGKLVMTEPVTLPLYGKLRVREIRKEALLAIWTDVIAKTGLEIGFQERVLSMTPENGGFVVETTRGIHHTARVLLAIGRRGTPRTLDVPGEEMSKVVYRLTDAAQYRGRRVLVSGGGDSALEAGLALADQPGTVVTLCYRGDVFNRARKANRERILEAAANGRIDVRLRTEIAAISPGSVRLHGCDRDANLANDHVIICAGGIVPSDFLRAIGITLDRKFGQA